MIKALVRVDGNVTESHEELVDIPADAARGDEELNEILFNLTGGNNDTYVGVEILKCDDRPDLVGYIHEAEDN